MCGIFFVLSKKKLNKQSCLSIANVLKKRGPDACKYEFLNDGHSFLCNTILNITGEIINDDIQLIQSRRKQHKSHIVRLH